jgi:hypothetical protein
LVDSNTRDLKREDFDDVISSIQVRGRSARSSRRSDRDFGPRQNPDAIVRRAYQDILERDPDQAGLRLYRSRIIDDGWTEQQVREALRDSPEFKEKTTMTRAKAEAIVRRAYQAVLNRDPDAGSAGYINRVFREGWTQEDVERELRQSAEYRSRRR